MVEIDLTRVARLERTMLTSWPALSTAFDGDWVIRLADGVTKRSNSVTCLGPDDQALDRRIERVEAIYRKKGLPAIFRLSPLASPALDRALDDRGWNRFDETIMMTADLSSFGLSPGQGADKKVAIKTWPEEDWLKSCFRGDEAKADALKTHREMIERIVPTAGFGRISERGRIAALAMVVIDAELTGLFEMLTIDEYRRQGLASTLLHQLFSWSRTQGASTAWLAVVADNLPALRLYESLGFEEVYRYHYRSNG
jgi:GNAT superfamily N-acetyltransferase